MSLPPLVLWTDIETDRLRHPERGCILEIAVLWTTLDRLYEPQELGHWVLYYREGDNPHAEEVALSMHRKSGLLEECSKSTLCCGDVEKILLAKLRGIGAQDGRAIHLAGSSIHFDYGYLLVHMPRLMRLCSHRVIDASGFMLLCMAEGMPPPPKSQDPRHRAVADIQESLDLARACRKWRSQAMPGFLSDPAPVQPTQDGRLDLA